MICQVQAANPARGPNSPWTRTATSTVQPRAILREAITAPSSSSPIPAGGGKKLSCTALLAAAMAKYHIARWYSAPTANSTAPHQYRKTEPATAPSSKSPHEEANSVLLWGRAPPPVLHRPSLKE